MYLNKGKFAFTLAEVLITLGIIGVVAQATIPTLVSSVNKNVLRTEFKQYYSELMQIAAMDDFQTNFKMTSDQGVIDSFASFFKNVKKGVNDTDFGMSQTLCFESSTICEGWGTGRPAFETAAGVSTIYGSYNGYADPCIYPFAFGDLCGEFVVDVNTGKKGPNMEGYDIYYIFLYKDKDQKLKVAPIGTSGETCVAGSTSWPTSEGCAKEVLLGTLR